jgi:hypothetical protein
MKTQKTKWYTEEEREHLKRKLTNYSVKDPNNGCQIWLGAKDQNGYGQTWNGKKPQGAHRLALELKLGRELKPTNVAHHKCGNKSCINPAHLEESSYSANLKGIKKKRREPNARSYIDQRREQYLKKTRTR